MKPQTWAVRLLVVFILLVFARANVNAQAVAGTSPASPPPAATGKQPAAPAQNKAEGNAPTAPSVGDAQQKQETPPPQISNMAQRPMERTGEPGQTTFEIRYDIQAVSVQGNTERSFLHACTRPQLIIFTPPARPRTCDSINNVAEISFLNNVPVFTNYRFETSIISRYTDNPRVDPERISLQRGYLRLVGQKLEATLGDSLVNYSRLSFSQNIKGLHVWRQWTDNVRITGTVGYFADRWGSLYRHFDDFRDITLDCLRASTLGTPPPAGPPFTAAAGCIESPIGSQNFVVSPANPFKPYSRFVAGMRLERRIRKNGWFAFNYSRGKDLQQSLPDAFITCFDSAAVAPASPFTIVPIDKLCTSVAATAVEVKGGRFAASEAANNHVLSLDSSFDVPLLRLKVAGEVAYSLTAGGRSAQSPVFGGALLDARFYSDYVADPAYRAEVSQKIGKLNWRLDYSRFQPNFSSANARQIRDLQDFNVRGDYQFTRQFDLTLSWRRSNDNLNAKRNFTSVVRAPEVRAAFRDLPFYRKMVLEVGYRERNLDTTGNPLSTCVDTSVPALSRQVLASIGCSVNPTSLLPETRTSTELRLKSTRIPFFSVTLPVKDTLVTLDYEHRHDMDRVVLQNSTDSDRYAFGFRGNYTWNNWDVIPSFRFEIERLAKRLPNNAALSLTDPTLLFPIDYFIGNDTSRSFNIQLQVEAPRYFRFEGLYREFNSISLTPLRASVLLDPLQNFFYLNQGFKRPYWRAALTYKIRNDENKLLTAYYERGNNFFDTGDPFVPDIKSFRETIIGGTLLIRFRR